MATERDIPMKICSPNASAERRITPSWTLAQLKGKLEPITGIPTGCQKLTLKVPGSPPVGLESKEEERAELSRWNLVAQAEIKVEDARPASQRNLDLSDLSSVPKYDMPEETYSALSSTVLAWKKANHLGRFDPAAPHIKQRKIQAVWAEVEERDIEVGKRCQVGVESSRRGEIKYVGEVPEIPGPGGPWIGVALDEPVGKNDGLVGGQRYFACTQNCGLFVRPGRVEVGDFDILLNDMDEDFEEI